VKREKEKNEFSAKDLNNIYLKDKKIQKCDLHPKLLSEKCRYVDESNI
jgi:hypothetical protein